MILLYTHYYSLLSSVDSDNWVSHLRISDDVFIQTCYSLILAQGYCCSCSFTLPVCNMCICDSTYQKVPVVGRLDIELWGCIKYFKIWSLSRFWDFTSFGIFNTLIFKLLEVFGAKSLFSCKNGALNCPNTNALYKFSLCEEPFSQNQFFTNQSWHPQWNYNISRT